MSQVGFTPIQLYRSATPGAVPLAADLAPGELAINTADQKLFFENASGTVVASVPFNTTGILGVANGGTGTATTFTTGSVVFAGASGVYSQDNASLFWDDTNNRLGIGTTAPTAPLEVSQVTTGTAAIQITSTSGTNPYLAFTDTLGTAAIAGGTSGTLLLRAGGATAAANKVYVLSSGNVGIGSTSPPEKLTLGTGNIQLADTFSLVWGGTANYITGSNASNYLALATSSAERMRITSAGAVLVGTTTTPGSPNARIVAGGTSDAGIQLASTSGGGALILAPNGAGTAFYTYTGAVGSEAYTERMRITSNGILGLATTPSVWSTGVGAMQMTNGALSSLEGPYGQINLTSNAYASGSADIGFTTWRYARGAIGDLGGTARYTMTGSEHSWFTAVSGVAGNAISYTQRMTLDSSGKLLFATTSLSTYVANFDGTVGIYSGNGLFLQNGSNNAAAAIYNGGASSVSQIQFSAGGGEKMRLDSSGNLGVSATPSAWGAGFKAIQMQNGTVLASHPTVAVAYLNSNSYYDGTNDRYIVNGFASALVVDGYQGGFSLRTAVTGTAGGVISFNDRMRVTEAGLVGIGTTAPNAQLVVAGVGAAGQIAGSRNTLYLKNTNSSGNQSSVIIFGSAGSGGCGIYNDISANGTTVNRMDIYAGSGGGVYLDNGATAWASASDERSKDIIEPILNAVQKVGMLRAVIGKYKTDAEGTRRSFLIAQDVQAVLPEAVNVGTDEQQTLGVAYTDTIPLLVAAIKELTARVAQLEGNQP